MKTVAISIVLSLVIGCWAGYASAAEHFGMKLPYSAEKVGEHRYKVGMMHHNAVKFFTKKFRGRNDVVHFTALSLPGVKLTHFRSYRSKDPWIGINISRIRTGVYIQFIPRDASPPPGS